MEDIFNQIADLTRPEQPDSDKTIEGNKLIAKFMKYDDVDCNSCKYTKDCNWLQCSLSDQEKDELLSYHSSWDWLMPCIEEIESLGYKWEIGMYYYQENRFHYCKIWSIGTIEAISPIDAVYGAVIEFIKWYNGK